MGRVARNWLDKLRQKFIKPSHRNITILHRDHLIIEDFHNISAASSTSLSPLRQQLTREDIAATKIQAVFRGHLARRAYVALRSLVKLQALARGAYARKQARIALQCMHALVRLQVRVRARQLLNSHTDNQ